MSKTQADGLPSVEAIKALDEVIAGIGQVGLDLDRKMLWHNFGEENSRVLDRQHRDLEDVKIALKAVRSRFRIEDMPPVVPPPQKVVRV